MKWLQLFIWSVFLLSVGFNFGRSKYIITLDHQKQFVWGDRCAEEERNHAER